MTVYVVGLDCADPRFVERWREELPYLSHLKAEGVSARLRSVRGEGGKISTAIAWPSLYTGRTPESHGITGWTTEEEALIGPDDVKGLPIWGALGESGLQTGLLNIPVTYPLPKVDGFVVSSFLTPSDADNWYYPEEITDTLPGSYNIAAGYGGPLHGGRYTSLDFEEVKEELFELMEGRWAAMQELMAEEQTDLFMVNFKSLDDIQHFFLDTVEDHPDFSKKKHDELGNVVKEAYVRLDEIIGELMEHLEDEDYLFVISDHGTSYEQRDLLTKLKKWAYMLLREKDFSKLWHSIYHGNNISGGHSIDGVFFAVGPDIQEKRLERIQLIDVMPTVLHLLGVDIPEGVEGRVVKEMFDEDSDVFHRPIKYATYANEESNHRGSEKEDDCQTEGVKRRLEALGYNV